jgi:hypothetical protein
LRSFLLGTLLLGEPFQASVVFGACRVIASVIVMWWAEDSSFRKQGASRDEVGTLDRQTLGMRMARTEPPA